MLSNIPPAALGSDPMALWRAAADAAPPRRGQRDAPPVVPQAVILPRTAAWLNSPAAAGEAAATAAPVGPVFSFQQVA